MPSSPRGEVYGQISDDPETTLSEVGEFGPDVAGSGTPVFEARTENGSYLTFCFPPEEVGPEYMRVFHVTSGAEGEFSFLMDRVFEWFGEPRPSPREVVFTNVVTEWIGGRDLDDRLHGFEDRYVEIPTGEPYAGEELRELVGEWDPRRGK